MRKGYENYVILYLGDKELFDFISSIYPDISCEISAEEADKIITAEWLVYNQVDTPFWAFEKGIYLEKFDTLFHIDASIKADTAYYYEPKKLWELRGNVHIRSQRGDKFDTELLYWNQQKEKIYSDKFIRIEQPDQVLTGYGFESNQQMTEYQIYNNTGVFTVEDTGQPDSTTTK